MCVAVIVCVGVVVVQVQRRRVRCCCDDTVASSSRSRRELGRACNEDRVFSGYIHPSLFMLAETCCAASLSRLGNRKKYFTFILPLAFCLRRSRPQEGSIGERPLPRAVGGRAQNARHLRGNCAGNPIPNSALQTSWTRRTFVQVGCSPCPTWRPRSLCCRYPTRM